MAELVKDLVLVSLGMGIGVVLIDVYKRQADSLLWQ